MKAQTNYVADDGKIFKTEKECKEYEEKLLQKSKTRAALKDEIQKLKDEKENLTKRIKAIEGDITKKTYELKELETTQKKAKDYEQRCTISRCGNDNSVKVHIEEDIDGKKNVFDKECSLDNLFGMLDKISQDFDWGF